MDIAEMYGWSRSKRMEQKYMDGAEVYMDQCQPLDGMNKLGMEEGDTQDREDGVASVGRYRTLTWHPDLSCCSFLHVSPT